MTSRRFSLLQSSWLGRLSEWRGLNAARLALLAILGIWLAFSISQELLAISNGLTLGAAAQMIYPTVGGAALFILLLALDRESLVGNLGVARVTLTQALALVPVALLLAWAIAVWLADLATTDVMVLILLLPGLAAACFLTLTRDDAAGLCLLFLILPLLSFVEWEYRASYLKDWQVGFVVLSPSIVLLWVFAILTGLGQALHGRRLIIGPLAPFLLLWALALFVSSMASIDRDTSLSHFVMEVLVFPLFYLLIVNRVRTTHEAYLVVGSLAVFGVLRLLIAYYFFLQAAGGSLWYSGYAPQAYATVQHTGVLSVVSRWTVAFCAGLFLIERRNWLNVLLLAAIALSLYLIVGTGERGGFLALALSSPIMLIALRFSSPRRWGILVTGLVLLALLIWLTPTGQVLAGRLARWNSAGDVLQEQEIRLDTWKAALLMIRDYPLTGIGPGMWENYVGRYSEHIWWWGPIAYQTNSAHELFLVYGSAGGVGALIAVAALVFRPILAVIRPLWKGRNRETVVLACAVLWGMATFVLAGSVGSGGFFEFVAGRSWDVDTLLDMGMLAWTGMGLLIVFSKLESKVE